MKSLKKIGVKIAAVSMLVAMSLNVAGCDYIKSIFNKDSSEQTATTEGFSIAATQSRTFTGLSNAADAKPGDIIIFGTYEQDNDESDGTEDIEWIVLDNTDGKLLVISKDILNYMRYSETTTVWEYSDIRTWLNGEFYDLAFSDDEKSSIVLSVVDNPGNPYFGTSAGTGTNDNVFCLSYDEAYTYFSFNSWNESSLSGNSQSMLLLRVTITQFFPHTVTAEHASVLKDATGGSEHPARMVTTHVSLVCTVLLTLPRQYPSQLLRA